MKFPKSRCPLSFSDPKSRRFKSQRLQDANATKLQTLLFYKSQRFSATKGSALLRSFAPFCAESDLRLRSLALIWVILRLERLRLGTAAACSSGRLFWDFVPRDSLSQAQPRFTVFQLSKQQNCTRTTSSTVLGNPPNRPRAKKFPLEKCFDAVALPIGFSTGRPLKIGTFTAWNRTRNRARTPPETSDSGFET